MNIEVASGKYVVAVSGGVDSVVLLDLLAGYPGLELVVAHFDHGIRADSAADRQFVGSLAQKYNLPFEFTEGKLGPKASEAQARSKRYEFLQNVRASHQADTILTAHHQDDVLETAIINMLRGTARRGLSSLRSTDNIKRPLLHFPKQVLLDYALAHNLQWHEDSTNQSTNYLRNYVRHRLLAQFDEAARQQLLDHIRRAQALNPHINELLAQQIEQQNAQGRLSRTWFINLPHVVAREVLAAWLRAASVQINRIQIEQLVTAAKTYRPGQQADVNKQLVLKVGRTHLALLERER